MYIDPCPVIHPFFLPMRVQTIGDSPEDRHSWFWSREWPEQCWDSLGWGINLVSSLYEGLLAVLARTLLIGIMSDKFILTLVQLSIHPSFLWGYTLLKIDIADFSSHKWPEQCWDSLGYTLLFLKHTVSYMLRYINYWRYNRFWGQEWPKQYWDIFGYKPILFLIETDRAIWSIIIQDVTSARYK